MTSASFPALLMLLMVFSVPSVKGLNKDIVIENGVYNNVLLGLSIEEGNEQDIQTYIDEIENFISEGSSALHFALNEKASIGDVTLVIPRSVNKTLVPGIVPGDPSNSLDSVDIVFHADTDGLPNTLQVEGCGIAGRQIQIPFHFTNLTDEQQSHYGDEGKIMAHEWAHFRYGVQDEHGFHNDPVYGIIYGAMENGKPTACNQGPFAGSWKKACSDDATCSTPDTPGCNFCPTNGNEASVVIASLGYLPALSEGKFCDSQTHVKNTTSPQNILCGGKSVMEVIQSHPDYEKMSTHPWSAPVVTVVQEPLPRVLLLLDTPEVGSPVVDYSDLLSYLKSALTTYEDLQVSIWTYTADDRNVTVVDNKRPFDTVEDYDSLYNFLPSPAARSWLPSLSEVFKKFLTSVDNYQPGTLIVMPLINDLIIDGDLTKEIGASFHERLMKPLVIFPNNDSNYFEFGSFLQWSGSRMLSSNGTGSFIYSAAEKEVQFFVDNDFKQDHAIVHHEKFALELGAKREFFKTYNGYITERRMAVITADVGIEDIDLVFYKYGVARNCKDIDECTYTTNSIYFSITEEQVKEWTMEVKNTGVLPANIEVTYSEVTYTGSIHELEISVWLTDGRGPIAVMDENADVKLYASVTNSGFQVMSTRIYVKVDIELTLPDGSSQDLTDVELVDSGADGDIRKDDSIYTYTLSSASVEEGTVIAVKAVKIIDHDVPRYMSNHKHMLPLSKKRNIQPQSQGLYTVDPFETPCCGSYVENVNTEAYHILKGYSYVRYDILPTITINRNYNQGQNTTSSETPPTNPETSSENPSSNPATSSENPSSNPATSSENPSSNPATSSENPSSNSATSSENPHSNPATSSENPPSNPTISSEITTSSAPDTTPESNELTEGQVAGIVIGSLAGFGVIAFASYYVYTNKMFCFASTGFSV